MNTIILFFIIYLCMIFENISAASYPPPKTNKKDLFFVLENFGDARKSLSPRTVRILLPPDYYETDKTYRVIYFFDGEFIFSKHLKGHNKVSINIDTYHQALLEENLIHPAIFVAIHVANSNNRRETRIQEMTPWPFRFNNTSYSEGQGGGLEKVYTFITGDLKPYIDTYFRTKPEAQYTGIGGISLGGLAACYLGYTYPEIFGLAACISPSLWWGHYKLVDLVAQNPPASRRARFWLHAATHEPWKPARQFAQHLIADGWREGDNLTYHHDHTGHHNYPTWNGQMRNMLYFLLRKTPPMITGIDIRNVDASKNSPIDLGRAGEEAYAFLKIQHTNEYSTTAIQPTITISDTNVAHIDHQNFEHIKAVGSGQALARTTYKGHKAHQVVNGYAVGEYPRLEIPQRTSPVQVDGDLSEWHKFPYYRKKSGNSIDWDFRFSVASDTDNLYIAVQVIDHELSCQNVNQPWRIDRLEFFIDARPDPMRSEGRGKNRFSDFLFLMVAPGETPEQTQIYRRRNSGSWKLPDNVQGICAKTQRGFDVEVAIPSEYLTQKQGGEWREVRLNICHNNFNVGENEGTPLWWQADWQSPDNYVGSGTFWRQLQR